MTGISVSVERPILLSAESHKQLNSARAILKQGHWGDHVSPASKNLDANDDVLERAYEDLGDDRRKDTHLSSTLRKLWSERGDFSKFKASTLLESKEDEIDDFKATLIDDLDFGATLNEMNDSYKTIGGGNVTENANEVKLAADKKDVMSIQDMLQLRTQMLEKLGTAQNALYFSHALVSLLLNSTKIDQGPASGSSAARAGSPGSVSAGAGLRGGGETVASTSALQRSINNVMGSPANLEAEIGVDSHVFGASRLEETRMMMHTSASEDNKLKGVSNDDQEEEEEEEEEIEGMENLVKEMQRNEVQDAKLPDIEQKESLEKLVTCLQAKKRGLDKAASILRLGATALRGDETRNKSEASRWRTLSQAKRAGWGLVADKPPRGASKRNRELLEDGNRKRDEAARDAWIGYAVPEAQMSFRRKSLAYVSHSSMSNPSASTEDNLAFVARPIKSLRITLLHQRDRWISRGSQREMKDMNEHLSRAQLEMFDAEVFEAVCAECRSIAAGSSVFSAKINNEDSVTIWLGNVQMIISQSAHDVEKEESETDEINTHTSSLADAILALLRLGLIRRYRSRSGAVETSNLAVKTKTFSGPSLPILLPIIGPIHFATFIFRLKEVLDYLKKVNAKVSYELHGLERIQGAQVWISNLLQGSEDAQSMAAVEDLGGSANILLDGKPFAFLTMTYPSDISLSLPTKLNALGTRGIHLARVDLPALKAILLAEVRKNTDMNDYDTSVL